MAANGKVLINLATGMEDGERVLVALGKDCPPLERLWQQLTEAGGELLSSRRGEA